MKIAVLDQSSATPAPTVMTITTALRAQGVQLATAWERQRPQVTYYASLTGVPTGFCIIAVLDNADVANALGYHDVTPDGRPYSRVFAKTILDDGGTLISGALSVSACASHELAEMFVDPAASWWSTYDGAGRQIALEACDPVQNSFYEINGIAMSNFVLPAYFNPWDRLGPYDHLGVLRSPAPSLDQGGYAIVDSGTSERQIFGEVPAWKNDLPHGRTAARLGKA